MTVSYPEAYEPYILTDGTEENGAPALRDTYTALRKALPQISYYASSGNLGVFMADSPGQRFRETADINGANITVSVPRMGSRL